MILGIEGYGSETDNDSESENERVATAESTQKASSSLPFSANIPKPSRPKRGPKKFTIELPSLPTNEDNSADDLKDERPPTKKPRLGSTASTLLSMLPAPKQINPALAPPVRSLGDGRGSSLLSNPSHLAAAPAVASNQSTTGQPDNNPPIPEKDTTLNTPFLPSSVRKGKSKVPAERSITDPHRIREYDIPPVDFFSLGNSMASSSKVTASPSNNIPVLPSVSSAPVIPTFEPPEPQQTDPYPGYYQLPSGVWAAHDPEYFSQFVKKWETEYNAHVRALEKGTEKGFEGLQTASVEEVDARREMEKAKIEIKEREERKAVTQGAGGGPVAPKMNINASKLSGIARSRHQLSTLLKEAYENREALEEKIAQGRRNRKEAGNKYGF